MKMILHGLCGILMFMTYGYFLIGCSHKPEIKYVYIKTKCPKLQTININELNLSKDKPLKLHIKVKDNE